MSQSKRYRFGCDLINSTSFTISTFSVVPCRITFLFFLLSLSCSLPAQTFLGIQGGYTYSTLSIDGAGPNFEQVTPSGGYFLQSQINVVHANRLSLLVGAELLQKNHTFERTGNYAGVYQSHKNLYVGIPLTIQVQALKMKRMGVFASLGTFVGYWASQHIEGTVPNAFNTTFDVAENGTVQQQFYLSSYSMTNQFNADDNRFELCGTAGIRFEYGLTDSIIPVVDVTYSHDFTSARKSGDGMKDRRFNQTVIASIGCLMKIK